MGSEEKESSGGTEGRPRAVVGGLLALGKSCSPPLCVVPFGRAYTDLAVSKVLLRPELPVPWLRKHTVIALYRLCRTSMLYPRCYVLKGIKRDSQSVDIGGFCDIYKGHYKAHSICLKVVRVSRDTENRLKVCFCL